MRRIAWLFCCLVALLGQPALGESLDDYVARVDGQIRKLEADKESAIHGPYWCNEILVNSNDHSWPVVGIYRLRYKFYYEKYNGDVAHDPHPYPDRLVKVTLRRDVSDHPEDIEFFYRAGVPVLYRRHSGEGKKSILLDGREGQLLRRQASKIQELFRRTLEE